MRGVRDIWNAAKAALTGQASPASNDIPVPLSAGFYAPRWYNGRKISADEWRPTSDQTRTMAASKKEAEKAAFLTGNSTFFLEPKWFDPDEYYTPERQRHLWKVFNASPAARAQMVAAGIATESELEYVNHYNQPYPARTFFEFWEATPTSQEDYDREVRQEKAAPPDYAPMLPDSDFPVPPSPDPAPSPEAEDFPLLPPLPEDSQSGTASDVDFSDAPLPPPRDPSTPPPPRDPPTPAGGEGPSGGEGPGRGAPMEHTPDVSTPWKEGDPLLPPLPKDGQSEAVGDVDFSDAPLPPPRDPSTPAGGEGPAGAEGSSGREGPEGEGSSGGVPMAHTPDVSTPRTDSQQQEGLSQQSSDGTLQSCSTAEALSGAASGRKSFGVPMSRIRHMEAPKITDAEAWRPYAPRSGQRRSVARRRIDQIESRFVKAKERCASIPLPPKGRGNATQWHWINTVEEGHARERWEET